MGNHIHFYIPILAKKYNPKSKGQALKGWYLSKHIKRLCDTKPEYVVYQKIMDVDGMVYESHKFLLVKELNLGLELRVDNMLYDVSYTDFNTFKRRLIFSNPRYDFSQGDLVAFLDRIEQAFLKYPDGFIHTS